MANAMSTRAPKLWDFWVIDMLIEVQGKQGSVVVQTSSDVYHGRASVVGRFAGFERRVFGTGTTIHRMVACLLFEQVTGEPGAVDVLARTKVLN